VPSGTVLDLRRGNRSAVMWELFFGAPLSRHELAEATQLSPATVTNVVTELLAEKLVIEAGTVSSQGGRPRTLVRVNPGYGYIAGVDVGETRVRVELFDITLRVALARADTVLEPAHHEVDVAVGAIVASLEQVTALVGAAPSDVLGVGVSVSGVVEQGARRTAPGQGGGGSGPGTPGHILVHGQSFGWDAVPLAQLLRDAGITAPVFVDNGASNLGQAESWFGAGRGARHAIVVLLGSGVGASIITGGSRYRGATSSAGEWGHTPIMVDGRACRCGARGCLESYVGAEAIVARYREAAPDRPIAFGDEERDLAEVLRRAQQDPAAREVLTETARYLGAGIAGLVNMFNPERIIIGGWAGRALCAALLPQIREAAAAQALRWPFAQAAIEQCALGDDAMVLGAATLPVEHLMTTTQRPATG
jgi:predicted NBD/HSP70 family sugar kinase